MVFLLGDVTRTSNASSFKRKKKNVEGWFFISFHEISKDIVSVIKITEAIKGLRHKFYKKHSLKPFKKIKK